MRDLLLILHITGAAAWLGGILYAAYTYSTLSRLEPSAAGPSLQRLQLRDDRYFGAASGLVLLSWVALVLTSDAFGWGDGFLIIGLSAFILTGILNATVWKGTTDRLVEASSAGNGVSKALRSWQQGTAMDFVLLLVVTWAMVTKIGA